MPASLARARSLPPLAAALALGLVLGSGPRREATTPPGIVVGARVELPGPLGDELVRVVEVRGAHARVEAEPTAGRDLGTALLDAAEQGLADVGREDLSHGLARERAASRATARWVNFAALPRYGVRP